MNVQCSWKVSDGRPISDAVFYNQEIDESDLEDEINVENCVFLQAPDKCDALYPTVPACQLLISCEPPNQITHISAICEARVLEIYGHHGEYIKTHFNRPLEDSENLFVYRGDVPLDKPLSVCSVKFVNLESQNEMWLFGVKIHTEKMPSLNQAAPITLQQKLGEMISYDDMKRLSENGPFSKPEGSFLKSIFDAYLLKPKLEMPNNNQFENCNIINSEGKELRTKIEEPHIIQDFNDKETPKVFASSSTSPVIIESQSTSTQTEENYVTLEENMKSYINEQIQGLNKRFQELEVKLLCKLEDIECFVKPHGVQNN